MADSLEFFATSDGGRFPSLGLGTWKIPGDLLPGLIPEAVKRGYRHLDCACDYGNEAAVGQGIRAAIGGGLCARDDLWITSKLWNTFHEPKHVRAACERSLRDLGLEELDLYLIHFPIALAYVDPAVRYPPGWFFDPVAERPAMKPVEIPYDETWSAMEELQRAGLVKRIGVSNLSVALLRDLLASCSIRPQVHQIELHPYLTQPRMLRFCREENIVVTAFSPFGASSYVPLGMARAGESLFDDPAMREIAAARGRTIAQIALRWAVQRGTVAIPKTQNLGHLAENIAIYDFVLSEPEMARIDELNRDRRFNDPGEFCEAAFHTFYPIFD
jgi:D-xylose reductase